MEDRDSRYEELKKQYDWEARAQEILQQPLQPLPLQPLYEQPAPVLKSAAEEAGLPEPVCLADIWSKRPEKAPVLIDGVLRQGHKMIISAPSKAGKSYALMELSVAIAEGMNWFGSRCRQGRVLYINMEIDDPSCYDRFAQVYAALGLNVGNHLENITVWGLRGYSTTITKLAPTIIATAASNYAAIIIDPLYKVMEGDENSNSDVGTMVAQFDKIARGTGASVIYAHHFAKGTGGDKSTIDRAAGAGAFARDPDAILTMTELDVPKDNDSDLSAWRIEYVLREFPARKPVSCWWKHPLHEIDKGLDGEEIETSFTKAARTRAKNAEEKRKEQIKNTQYAAQKLGDGFTLAQFKDAYAEFEELSENTARSRLKQAGYTYELQKNGVASIWKKA